jgi:Flp pilus assembly protein TadG
MIYSSASRQRSNRPAGAAVEFALIAPLFFSIFLGIVEFGRMLMVQEILVNAARVGARQATLPLQTDAQVTAAVSNYLAATGISGYSQTLNPTLASSPGSGTALSLTITVPFAKVSWYPAIFLSGRNLSATVVMIKE